MKRTKSVATTTCGRAALFATSIYVATAIPAAFLDLGIPLETTEWVAFTATTQEQLSIEVWGAIGEKSWSNSPNRHGLR